MNPTEKERKEVLLLLVDNDTEQNFDTANDHVIESENMEIDPSETESPFVDQEKAQFYKGAGNYGIRTKTADNATKNPLIRVKPAKSIVGSEDDLREDTDSLAKENTIGSPFKGYKEMRITSVDDKKDYTIPLTFEYTKSLIDDLYLRNKLVRDAVIQQVFTFIGIYIKIKKKLIETNSDFGFERKDSENDEENSQKELNQEEGKTPEIKIGILGAGLMGKIFIDLLGSKTILGHKIVLEVSTRVPENLTHQKFSKIDIYYNNRKLAENNEIILLCTNKHKSLKVFNSFKNAINNNLSLGKVTY